LKYEIHEGVPILFENCEGDPAPHLLTMNELLQNRKSDFIYFNGQDARGKMFTLNHCVGHIEFTGGSSAEIYPKFNSDFKGNPDENLMIMLYKIFGIDLKNSSKTANMFEFFVRVFTSEVNTLIMKGLRSAYIRQQGNETVLKGRILFAENIKENLIHKERIFCEYEIFTTDRAENRLIKSTIEILLKKTKDNNNKKFLKTLLMDLEEVPSSTDIANDFATINLDRNMVDYTSPMVWCNLFLNSMGLSEGSRSGLSYALLMDSDKIFEAYVAKSSLATRKDGSYSLKYNAWVETNAVPNGDAVIVVEPVWSFFDRKRDEMITDAEYLFMTCPGFSIIPPLRDDKGHRMSRIRSMAQQYLLAEQKY